jgi:hypothetical protein
MATSRNCSDGGEGLTHAITYHLVSTICSAAERKDFPKPSRTFGHSGEVMTNSPSRLRHFVALLLALIPLAVMVGACVTCP